MKKKYSFLLGGLLASVVLAGQCAEADMNAVFEKDTLCDATSTKSLYSPPVNEVTIKALKQAKWVSGKPKNENGEKVYAVSPGKTWLGFRLKNVIVPNPKDPQSFSIFGTLVTLDGSAEKVAAEIEKIIQETEKTYGKWSKDWSFKPLNNLAPGQNAFSRPVRYRSGSIYNVIVNELSTPQGPETVVYCVLTNAE